MAGRAQQGVGVQTDRTVAEGGTLEIKVGSGAKRLLVAIPGRATQTIPVNNGKAEFPVPPDVPGGSIIIITDGKPPNPSSTTVTVVGTNQ